MNNSKKCQEACCAVVLLASALPNFAMAGVLRSNATIFPSERYEEFGFQTRFNAVGTLLSRDNPAIFGVTPGGSDGSPSFCSGTLIAANAFLTAAHCVSEYAGGSTVVSNTTGLSVGFGGNFDRLNSADARAKPAGAQSTAPRVVMSVFGIELHPDFQFIGGTDRTGPDLAILRIGTPRVGAPVSSSIAPAQIYRGTDEFAGVAPTAIMTGYGMWVREGTIAFLSSGTKRAGLNEIDSVERWLARR